MVFSSIDFIFQFLPVFFIVYSICPFQWKNRCLFMGSLIFYYDGVKSHPFYFLLFLISIGVNYLIGEWIGRYKKEGKKWLIIGTVYNLFWLVLFKYAGFIIHNVNQVFDVLGCSVKMAVFQPDLPIGISFYTFQALSYLIDVYNGKTSYEKSLSGFGFLRSACRFTLIFMDIR